MQRRHGTIVADALVITLITVMILTKVFFGGWTTGLIGGKVNVTAENIYSQNAVAEDILAAPCATKTRGVFYKSAVKTGDFHCLHPKGDILLRFSYGGDSEGWRISRGGGGIVTVRQMTWQDLAHISKNLQTYRVQIYGPETNTFEGADMQVSVQ